MSAEKTLVNKMGFDTFVLFNILIIAGLRHILSLHFTVLINFDEYWICFLQVGLINTHSHLVSRNYSKIMFTQRTLSQ